MYHPEITSLVYRLKLLKSEIAMMLCCLKLIPQPARYPNVVFSSFLNTYAL